MLPIRLLSLFSLEYHCEREVAQNSKQDCAMPVLETLFLGVLAFSILTSIYMLGLFLHRVRAQRIGLDETLRACFMGEEDAERHDPSLGDPVGRQVISMRKRRMHVCASGPELLVVPGNGYAAVILPMDVDANHRDLIQCKVYLN